MFFVSFETSGCLTPLTSIAQGPGVSEHAWASVCTLSCSLPWVRPPFAVAKSMILIVISVYRTLARFWLLIGLSAQHITLNEC
jgi:hypothetical protein